MSSTNLTCDFCSSVLPPVCYSPSGTRKRATVHVCNNCGLTQSHYALPDVAKVKTLSTDADWGNVRHGKGVRLPYLVNLLRGKCHLSRIGNVLDIGSNRGDFIEWAVQNTDADISALEPDTTVVESYPRSSKVHLILDRFEKTNFEPKIFDLIFCSHTLEHVDSAADLLVRSRESLKDDGIFLIEVPNIQAISLGNYVEEFFIDKHKFHFDRGTLVDFCKHLGFKVLSGEDSNDPMNITLLLGRGQGIPNSKFGPRHNTFEANSSLIGSYKIKLEQRRRLVKEICESLLIPLCVRQKVGFYGAGRIFDTLVKYGGLTAEHVHCLVDGYLWKVIQTTHGVKVERPEFLKLHEPQVVVILGNSAEHEMSERAYSMGIRHVVKFSELIEQFS